MNSTPARFEHTRKGFKGKHATDALSRNWYKKMRNMWRYEKSNFCPQHKKLRFPKWGKISSKIYTWRLISRPPAHKPKVRSRTGLKCEWLSWAPPPWVRNRTLSSECIQSFQKATVGIIPWETLRPPILQFKKCSFIRLSTAFVSSSLWSLMNPNIRLCSFLYFL